MKLYDKSTMDLAQAVQDVLEGKAPVKEMEMKYPHDMFDPKTGKKEVAKDEAEHKALDAKGYTHEAPKENVAGPADLSVDQNVKKVQAKHGAVKKVDLTPKSVQEAYNEVLLVQAIQEARQLKDPKTEVLVVKDGKVEVINKTDLKKFMAKGYGLAEDDDQDLKLDEAINPSDPASNYNGKAQLKLAKYLRKTTGAKGAYFDGASLVASMKSEYPSKTTVSGALDPSKKVTVQDLIDAIKNIKESKEDEDMDEAEMSAKQAAYRKVFDAAMKKFGVKSPAELEGDKKKKFFDYVDANYDAEGEVEEGVGDFFNKAKKAVKKGVDKVTGADKKSKSANDAQAGATAALSKRARPGGKSGGDRIKVLKDKIAGAIAKSKAADKRGDDDARDMWDEVVYNAEQELAKVQKKANEGVSDFFNKAKNAVKGKKPAPNDAMKAPTRKAIDITKAGIRNAEEGLKKAEQKFKDKKISKERMDELDDYYQERLLKAETELKELEAKLKGLDKKLGKTN